MGRWVVVRDSRRVVVFCFLRKSSCVPSWSRRIVLGDLAVHFPGLCFPEDSDEPRPLPTSNAAPARVLSSLHRLSALKRDSRALAAADGGFGGVVEADLTLEDCPTEPLGSEAHCAKFSAD